MKRKLSIPFFCSLVLLFSAIKSNSQTIYTADSLKSGNAKDVFTSFFQLAFDNLTGSDKSFTFNSNPFAIMAKAHPDSNLNDALNYYRYRHWRSLNFNIGIKADDKFNFSSLTIGAKYSIINKRDITINKGYFIKAANVTRNSNFDILIHEIAQITASIPSVNDVFANKFIEETNKLLVETPNRFSYNNLPDDVKAYIDNVVNLSNFPQLAHLKLNPNENPWKLYNTTLQEIRDEYLTKPIWTIEGSANTYQDDLFLSEIKFSSQFLCGIAKNSKRTCVYELDLKAQYYNTNDSFLNDKNLKRKVFNGELGFNLTLRSPEDYMSYFEIKIGAGYNHILSTARNGEEQNVPTANAELRLRIYKDIWLPLTLKYDLNEKNVFGFINIKTNFKGLEGLFTK